MNDYNGHQGADLDGDEGSSGYASAQAGQNGGWYQQGIDPQEDAGAAQQQPEAQYGYQTGYDVQQYAQAPAEAPMYQQYAAPAQYAQQQPAPAPAQYGQYPPKYAVAPVGMKSKWAAGLFGIFLGSLGVHNFYLGRTGKAVTQLLLTVVGWIFVIGPVVAAVWGLIEGILILTSRPGSPWHKDGSGYELTE